MEKREVHASVKDEQLVEKRRKQMIKGAVTLFREKGFHRTTTREIAKAAGFSIGTLYEYIRSKEDVLYLVCDYIYEQFQENLQEEFHKSDGTLEGLKRSIAYFYQSIDDRQDEVLVMYQEVKALTKDALSYVLKKEIEMVSIFEKLIQQCVDKGEIKLNEKEVCLMAHNIFVHGQMWSFRRWALHKTYSLKEYIELQTDLMLKGISNKEGIESKTF
ncbi:TetR/AcrR family transcriptional regulator [Peribacillus asahii]|uniref:TetR/AcrR family transcriptional regulator n=1 Tax=Peribacillus asahii TaxID=228899 RepID=UPI00381926AC